MIRRSSKKGKRMRVWSERSERDKKSMRKREKEERMSMDKWRKRKRQEHVKIKRRGNCMNEERMKKMGKR